MSQHCEICEESYGRNFTFDGLPVCFCKSCYYNFLKEVARTAHDIRKSYYRVVAKHQYVTNNSSKYTRDEFIDSYFNWMDNGMDYTFFLIDLVKRLQDSYYESKAGRC